MSTFRRQSGQSVASTAFWLSGNGAEVRCRLALSKESADAAPGVRPLCAPRGDMLGAMNGRKNRWTAGNVTSWLLGVTLGLIVGVVLLIVIPRTIPSDATSSPPRGVTVSRIARRHLLVCDARTSKLNW